MRSNGSRFCCTASPAHKARSAYPPLHRRQMLWGRGSAGSAQPKQKQAAASTLQGIPIPRRRCIMAATTHFAHPTLPEPPALYLVFELSNRSSSRGAVPYPSALLP